MSKVDLKVVLLGKEFGGKTSLVERYVYDRFRNIPYQNTIGAAYVSKKLNINGKKIIMGIWDTAGAERYEAMTRIYYREAFAAIVCHDITDDASFKRIGYWIEELQKNEQNCRIYICGTKKDLVDQDRSSRKTDYHLVTDYAEGINAVVFETSSKTGENVEKLFNRIAEDFTYFPPPKSKDIEEHLSIQENPVPTKRLACCS